MELRIGDKAGMVKLAIPSITLKMLRHKFDPQSTIRRSVSPEMETAIKQVVTDGLKLDVDCALVGSRVRLSDLLHLKTGGPDRLRNRMRPASQYSCQQHPEV